MKVLVVDDESAVAEAAALRIAEAARAAVLARGAFRLALAGGSTPKLAYERLAEAADVPWGRVEIFFGDERMVSPDHDASNFKMAGAALLSRVPASEERVHRIHGELGGEAAAQLYEAELGDAPLDLVLLGMGGDGHTASLFPGGVPDDETRRVARASGPPPQVERVTLTLRGLEEAGACLFLVTGTGKAERLREVFSEVRAGRAALPAAKVAARCRTEWIVDRAAGALVSDG